MTDLERELMQTLKNFIGQYEEDKRQQAEQYNRLAESVNALIDQNERLTRAFNNILLKISED